MPRKSKIASAARAKGRNFVGVFLRARAVSSIQHDNDDDASSYMPELNSDEVAVWVFDNSGQKWLAVWVFDYSTGHSAYASDALYCSKARMNTNPGGKNTPIMRDGWFMRGGLGVSQQMYTGGVNGDPKIPKRMKAVLSERGLLAPQMKGDCGKGKGCSAPGATRTDCCLRSVLQNQPDFKGQKSTLDVVFACCV